MVNLDHELLEIVGLNTFQILLLDELLLHLCDSLPGSVSEDLSFLICLWNLCLLNKDSDSLVHLVLTNIGALVNNQMRIFHMLDKARTLLDLAPGVLCESSILGKVDSRGGARENALFGEPRDEGVEQVA